MAPGSGFAPWRDDSELAMVRDWFYPQHAKQDPYEMVPASGTGQSHNYSRSHGFGHDDEHGFTQADRRRQALGRVSVWTFRTFRVPHAVLATADLTDAVLHVEREEQRKRSTSAPESGPSALPPISYRALQSILCMALTRFVNGLVDRDSSKAAATAAEIGQGGDEGSNDEDFALVDLAAAKAAGESSMYANAVRIGLPSHFVTVRHQASHGQAPELAALRELVTEALEWLWLRWWSTKATGDPGRASREYAHKHETRNQRAVLSA